MPLYKDLYDLPEDDRIKEIAEKVQRGLCVGFLVDKEVADVKAKRYIAKLKKILPAVQVQFMGDLDNHGLVTLVRVQLPKG